jgi:hypothetical protein
MLGHLFFLFSISTSFFPFYYTSVDIQELFWVEIGSYFSYVLESMLILDLLSGILFIVYSNMYMYTCHHPYIFLYIAISCRKY